MLLDHQWLAVLLEKEPHASNGERRAELDGVRHDRVEIEELDGLQGAPDLFPPAALFWGVEHIDEGPLEGRNASRSAGMAVLDDATPGVGERAQGPGKLHRHELGPAEGEPARALARQIREAVRDRVRLPVELQRGVVRNDGVSREPGGEEIRID